MLLNSKVLDFFTKPSQIIVYSFPERNRCVRTCSRKKCKIPDRNSLFCPYKWTNDHGETLGSPGLGAIGRFWRPLPLSLSVCLWASHWSESKALEFLRILWKVFEGRGLLKTAESDHQGYIAAWRRGTYSAMLCLSTFLIAYLEYWKRQVLELRKWGTFTWPCTLNGLGGTLEKIQPSVHLILPFRLANVVASKQAHYGTGQLYHRLCQSKEMDIDSGCQRPPGSSTFSRFSYIDLMTRSQRYEALAATESILQFFKRGCVYLGPAAVLKIFKAAIFKTIFGIFKRQGFYLHRLRRGS